MIHIELYQIDGCAKIKLLQPIRFFIGYNEFEVPIHYVSDGCSVPKFLWGLICPCIDQRTLEASIVHDFLYSMQITTRFQADMLFLKMLLKNGFPMFKAFLAFVGVRFFGSFHWI